MKCDELNLEQLKAELHDARQLNILLLRELGGSVQVTDIALEQMDRETRVVKTLHDPLSDSYEIKLSGG